MQASARQSVDMTGAIANRQVFCLAEGQALAKARPVLEGSDEQLWVVWWEPGRAPSAGDEERDRF